MTDQELNFAIAKACGWKRVDPFRCGRDVVRWPVFEKNGHRASYVTQTMPNYVNDLNAMHEAESTLSEEQGGMFEEFLEDICQRDLLASKSNHWLRFKEVHATARQRAEAFVKTIG